MDKLKITIQVTLSLGAIIGLVGCGELPTDSGAGGDTTPRSDYGLSLSNGLSNVNGLSATNGLSGTNGLSMTNGLSSVNGLSATNGLMTTDWGRRTVAYLVKCALNSGDSLVKADQNGTNYTYQGSLGLCPAWKNGGVSSDTGCQEYLSACLMALTNTAGVHVPLWLDAAATSIGWGQSSSYPNQEGTYFGNIMVLNAHGISGLNAYYCEGPGFNQGVVPGRLGADLNGSVYRNPFGNGGRCDQNCTASDAKTNNNADGYKACAGWNDTITVWRASSYSPVFDSTYYYRFDNLAYGPSLDVYSPNGFNYTQGNVMDGWGANGQPVQKFYVQASGSNWKITPIAANWMCVDEASTSSGAGVILNSCNGGSSQQWAFEPDANGHFKIRNVASNHYLRDSSGTWGTPLTVVSSASNNDQVWKVYAVQ